MDRLPRDIVFEILSRLPVTSLVQTKSVCKSWRKMVQSSLLADKNLSHMSQTDPAGIIFQSDWPIQNQFYFLDLGSYPDGNQKKQISVSTKHANLAGSSNGLLCFFNSSQIHICNPFTKFSIELQKLSKRPGEVGILGFGFISVTNEYKLIEMVYQRESSNQSEVRILTLGDPCWRTLGMVPYRFIQQPSQVMVNGMLHWISKLDRNKVDNQIISFDIAAEQFQEVPKPGCKALDSCIYELLALQGHLCAAADNANGGLDIWVMKEYNMKESWIKEFTINGFLPKELQQINENASFPKPGFQALCRFRDGEILLQHTSRELFLYDPVHETFKDLSIEGAPSWCKMVVHVGSLTRIRLLKK